MSPDERSLPLPDLPFHDAVARAMELVNRWLMNHDDVAELNEFPDGIFVRNLERTLVLSNAAFRALFPPGQVSNGRSSRIYLSASVRRYSEGSDALLIDGVKSLELEHEFDLNPGEKWDLRVHKRLIRGQDHPPYLVGILRPIARYDTDVQPRPDLIDAARLVGEFDEIDLKICRGICSGATNQVLSGDLGMTTRAVEMRRQKILAQLGLNQTVELVKLLVRLQDRGYLDLGI